MEENIALIIPADCPELKTFNLPMIPDDTIFKKMQAITEISTPTIVSLTENEVQFILDNRVHFDVPMYMVDFLPDYDFSPKWITYLTQFETVSFDSLSQLIGIYQADKAESAESIKKQGDHVTPIVNEGIEDEEDGDIEIIAPERI